MALIEMSRPAPPNNDILLAGLNNFIAQQEAARRQQEQQDAENQRQTQALQAAQHQNVARAFMALPADQQAAYYPQLQDEVKSYLLDPSKLPPHTPTPDEQLHTGMVQKAIEQIPSTPASVAQAGAYQAGYRAAMPADLVKQQDAADVYGHPQSFPPQMQTRQAIEDKSQPTGEQTANLAQLGPVRASEAKKNTATATAEYATAGLAGAKTKAVTAGLTEDGTLSPAVQNLTAAALGAAKQGLDPKVVLDRIADKKVKQAVVEQLAKPENVTAIQKTPLKAAQATALAEIEPIIAQAKKVQAAYAPYKDQNGLTDRDSIDYGLYMLGKKPPDDSPSSQLANLQMLKVQAGARLLKGGSRAYPALKMAMQHAGDGFKDTRAQIFDKTSKLLAQLEQVRQEQQSYGRTGATGDAGGPAAAGPTSDPLGLFGGQ